ncbi:phosphatase PAP2 family protein [Thermoleptolyngbya oregonensis NK1-22]|uniref:Phosphatase PAP2 family protein n=1 Tax=Thermoleptolyngbya oregonensis NK1-22 TaxID=2547457 RepID=A0AA96Y2M1_9CYAN|nr:phosphatase PAP2 family protein [Thermoleptolyngbya oregonensis]WOB41781.1 phosphatase PAP2 family protein [Thermoleptolyngbya oregonensis NK1-22]
MVEEVKEALVHDQMTQDRTALGVSLATSLWILGVGLPLAGFGLLGFGVWTLGNFPWDEPILQAVHAASTPALDRIAQGMTRLGSPWILPPLAGLMAIALVPLQRWRSLLYVVLSLAGSTLINIGLKDLWKRDRPFLWESGAPRPHDFSFPSGHAMTSVAIGVVLLILLGSSRWRPWAALFGVLFVLAIGWTRLYLGVHYPSDILGGWLVAIAWTVGLSLLIQPQREKIKPQDEK